MFRSLSLTTSWRQAPRWAGRLAVLWGLGLLLTPANLAQYRFDSWTTDNGLPQNGIRQITQTPDGYLWFTTFDGLVRFDGMKFTVFTKGNSPGILHNRFAKVIADKHGTVWAQTEDQMLTVYRNGVFTTYTNAQIPGGLQEDFRYDAAGEVVLVTKSGWYYLRQGQFVFIQPRVPEDARRVEYDAPSGTKWILTPGRVEQIKNGQVTVYQLPTISLVDPASAISEITLEDRDGALWFGVGGVGACRLLNGQVTTYGETSGIPKDAFPRYFRQEADGSVWFSTGDANTKGYGIFRWVEGKITRFGAEVGLSNEQVMGLFRDREGTLWVATNKGLDRLRRQIITSYSVKEGLSNFEVYPIMKSRDGDIVIGTATGISRFRDGKFTTVPGSEHENIQALVEDPQGQLRMGITGNFVRLEQGRKIPYDTGNTVAATLTRGGSIWTGSNVGLARIDHDQVTARFNTADGLPSNEVKTIVEDTDCSLWVGTYGGLSHFADGKFINYTVKEGLASNLVRSIYKDKEGVFWIGTYDGGLSRFKDGKFFNFTTENGLFNNGVFATVEDDFGNLWMSCNRGIYRANKQQLNDFADGKIAAYESFAYGKEDGMLNTECNGGRQPSALKDADGRIWFPTLDGVAVVDPRLVEPNPVPPPVVIETVAVDRTAVPEPQKLAAMHDPQKVITVQPSQTSVDITYTGLSFIKSDQIRFRYKLDGLDGKWIDAGTRRTVNYSYLPPGTYTFTVIAANSDGVWNNQGQSIRIVVLAPFYRTWWFRGLAVLVLIGIGFMVYRYRVAQLRKVHRAREAFSQELIESQEAFSRQLIESQEGERKRIAAELHDSLGQNLLVIKNRALLGLAVAEKERSKEQFGEIQESVTQALSEVRSIAYNLRPLHLERLGLTSTIEEAVEQVQAASGIKIECDVAPLDDLFHGDAEINFYRIVQECLNNIVKHSGAAEASVTIHRTNNSVSLTVKDNGRGFDLEELQRQHRLGLGLNGIAERVKILGGTYSLDSRLGEGTTVAIEIGRTEGVV
jgi:signal transduction histidine kinase/ligand-binding sensor domain-containing protein